MIENFEFKEHYSVDDLVGVMQILRGENGCPWDKQQTHHSIRNNLLEEAYEAVEAIDRGDNAALKEELGDILLQVVFHCQIERELGSFDLCDVADGVCKKLILRHPHIFAEGKADTAEQVLKTWEEIKMAEKGQATVTDTLKSVPAAFPALMRAAKVQKRALANIRPQSADELLIEVGEQLSLLEQAVEEQGSTDYESLVGELLFKTVGVARALGADAEEVLQKTTNKFVASVEEKELN